MVVDVFRCPYTNLRRAFSLCTTKNEIDTLIKFANSLGPDEKKTLLATGKEKYLKRLKNKFQKIKSADLSIPFMTEGYENIQQIFATIIDYDDFTALVYKDPTNPLLSGILDFASPHPLLIKIFSRRLINILSKTEEFNFNNEIRVYFESMINNSEAEKPTNCLISNHDLKVCIKAIKFFTFGIKDKCLNINESTYTDDMFTSIMKDFCLNGKLYDLNIYNYILLIKLLYSGELETTCSRHCRQGLHEGSNIMELSLLSEMELSVGNFKTTFLDIDKSKRGHKIDAAIGIRLMNEHLIQFLIVESKKPGTDPSNDKKNNCKNNIKFYKDDQLEITVYDIPGSLIGRRRIKKLLKNLKSQLRDTEDILNKLVKQGDNNNKLQIDIRNRTIVRNNRNSSGAM
ncbi:hypothetical protein C2G38_2168590 [Gigaspora rosea]|uniref:Uncharacterized protein n=1 Tax=Gigaspora rosea TaxID=44941 RepID=A0A397VRL6_9GLOM|nr:hypothetical protein C2G38_2168590 [Gigaspora rosea]